MFTSPVEQVISFESCQHILVGNQIEQDELDVNYISCFFVYHMQQYVLLQNFVSFIVHLNLKLVYKKSSVYIIVRSVFKVLSTATEKSIVYNVKTLMKIK